MQDPWAPFIVNSLLLGQHWHFGGCCGDQAWRSLATGACREGLIYCLHSKSLGTDFCSTGRQRMGQVKCSLLQRGNCVCASQHGAPALLASNSCNLQGCRTNCQNVRGAARTRHHCVFVFFDNRNRQWTKDCQGTVPAGAPIAE